MIWYRPEDFYYPESDMDNNDWIEATAEALRLKRAQLTRAGPAALL
jgi:hypothetical protein